MAGAIDWQFSAKGLSGRAHFERDKDVFVIFDGEEVGRIPAEELRSILSEDVPPKGRAARLIAGIQTIMQGEIYGHDVAAGHGRLQIWIAASDAH